MRAGQQMRLSNRSVRGERAGTRRTAQSDLYRAHGDTLPQIAQLFQVSVSQILAWNGIAAHPPFSPARS